jgi:sulfite oxidase
VGKYGKRDDTIVHEADPYNAEPSRAALDGLPITPLDVLYGRNHGRIPQVDADTWQLDVGGLVQTPLTLTLAELRHRFPQHSVVATLVCAGNRRAELMRARPIPGQIAWGPGAISTAEFTGARLADVLAAAVLSPDTAHIAFTAPDLAPNAVPPQTFGASIPVAKATAGEVLLAWEVNAAPLPAVHGGPVRAVVPGYIGARSVKWVRRITAQDHPSDNYFQAVDYRLLPADADPNQVDPGEGLALGVVALNAAILRPDEDQTLPTGPTEVSGYAIAGEDRRIARVDVSLDAGHSWQQADLGPDLGPWAWRLWQAIVSLPRGQTEIIARAWDTSGTVQPESLDQVWNPLGYANTAWHRIRVTGRPVDATIQVPRGPVKAT